MPAPVHIFTGKVGAVPVFFTDPSWNGSGWFHVNCLSVGPQVPCAVSLTEEGMAGGDRLDPSCSGDWYGNGIWVCGPKTGTNAIVSIERRNGPSYRTISPMGERTATTSLKAVAMGRAILNNQTWHPIITNVIGNVGLVLRVTGGQCWIGTHMRSQQPFPPTEQDMLTTGGAFPIFPGDPPLVVEGNPGLYAGAFDPGVTLHLLKQERGAIFVVDPSL